MGRLPESKAHQIYGIKPMRYEQRVFPSGVAGLVGSSSLNCL
jgi:hypothetical protein